MIRWRQPFLCRRGLWRPGRKGLERQPCRGNTVISDSRRETCRLPYLARDFDALPNARRAEALLADLAEAPCPVGPAVGSKPLALYGAGNLGRLARDYLKAVDRDFALAVDRAAGDLASHPQWQGVHMLVPEAVPDPVRREVRLAVSVVTTPYVPLAASLRAAGFEDVVPFYDIAEGFRHLHPLSNGWFAAPLAPADYDNTAAVLAGWDDDESRAHHLQFLAWRRLRQEWRFAGAHVSNDNRFFIPEVRRALRADEVFVDGGAHHGEVSIAFAHIVGAFRQIVAIEPDPVSRVRLIDNVGTRLGEGVEVEILDCALSDAEGEAPFHHGLDYASQLAPTGHLRVMRRRLDTLDLAPTVLKLHLEGAELLALKGARATLRTHRPIVLTTVYHNADGIWATPLWLMRTLPDYRFLFRTHSWCGTGAVIYAIPQERSA
jgi:FkbM family methyltransferase